MKPKTMLTLLLIAAAAALLLLIPVRRDAARYDDATMVMTGPEA